MSDPSSQQPGAPSSAALAALGSDGWAVLLGAVRRALADPVTGEVDRGDDLERLRQAPTSRLVAGPLRDELIAQLHRDARLWSATVASLPPRGTWPTELAALVAPSDADHDDGDAGDDDGRDHEHGGYDDALGTRQLADARRRLRDTREERDTWRRRAQGERARAERLAEQREQVRAALATAEQELDRLRAELRDAADERRRAVDRERRRRDGEIARLEATIATLRRTEQQHRDTVRRREQAEVAAAREADRAKARARREAADARRLRVVPGRPSRLPPGLAPGTTEAAAALLHRGRLVLVDGYNVTKQHRASLDLEAQRVWLVQLLGTLARQRGIRPVVIFDGQAGGGGRPPAGLREVEVRFTVAGITADDELVLAVEATDDPVVVVTDDRELVGRVTASGADVIGTRSLLGVAP